MTEFLVWGLLAAFAVKGFMKGLVREVCSLAGVIFGGWAAVRFSGTAALLFRPYLQLPPKAAAVVSFVAILLATLLLFYLLGHLLTGVLKLALLGGVNRIGGVAFGLCEGALLLAISMHFIASESPLPALRRAVAASGTGRALAECGGDIVSGWRSTRRSFPEAASRKVR